MRTKRRLSFPLPEFKGKLINKDLSLISNNCIGGIIQHDLKLKFNSPTINLFFPAPDYILFLENLDYYLNQDLTELNYSKYGITPIDYPLGKLNDIEIHFVHYKSFEEAKEKWMSRIQRINKKNIFIIASDRDYCNQSIIDRFLNLPYSNKIFFSSKKLPFDEILWFREYAGSSHVGDLIQDDQAWYYHFDVLEWFNTGQIKRTPAREFLFRLFRLFRRSIKNLR
jgi:uncharacterized protein (DUF1919 family)